MNGFPELTEAPTLVPQHPVLKALTEASLNASGSDRQTMGLSSPTHSLSSPPDSPASTADVRGTRHDHAHTDGCAPSGIPSVPSPTTTARTAAKRYAALPPPPRATQSRLAASADLPAAIDLVVNNEKWTTSAPTQSLSGALLEYPHPSPPTKPPPAASGARMRVRDLGHLEDIRTVTATRPAVVAVSNAAGGTVEEWVPQTTVRVGPPTRFTHSKNDVAKNDACGGADRGVAEVPEPETNPATPIVVVVHPPHTRSRQNNNNTNVRDQVDQSNEECHRTDIQPMPTSAHFSDFPHSLWQLWRCYVPCGLAALDALGVPRMMDALHHLPYTPRTGDGQLADRLMAQLCVSLGAAHDDPSNDSHRGLFGAPVARHATCREEEDETQSEDDPVVWLDMLLWRLTGLGLDAEVNGDFHVNMCPRHSVFESESLARVSLTFVQTHYAKELTQCLSFAYHLMRTAAYMRRHPAPLSDAESFLTSLEDTASVCQERDPLARTVPYKSPAHPQSPDLCPCGCVYNGAVIDRWSWDFHAHYYRAHNMYRSPDAHEGQAGAQCTALAMLPFVAVELFARVVIAVTESCAEEEARYKKQKRSRRGCRHRLHRRSGDDSDTDTLSSDADVDLKAGVFSEKTAKEKGGAHAPQSTPQSSPPRMRQDAFRTFFSPVKQQLVIAACVLLAWKHVDINAVGQMFFLEQRARRCVRRLRHSGVWTLTDHSSGGQSDGAPSFVCDAFLDFRLNPDMDIELLKEMERYVLGKVAASSVFGRVPVFVAVATDLTTRYHERRLADAVEQRERILAHCQAEALAEQTAWEDHRLACAKADFHTAIDKVVCTAIEWLMVPEALVRAPLPVTRTGVAALNAVQAVRAAKAQHKERSWSQCVTQHHPLLGVALAVQSRAVPHSWASALVAPAPPSPVTTAEGDDKATTVTVPHATGNGIVKNNATSASAWEVDGRTQQRLDALVRRVDDALRTSRPL